MSEQAPEPKANTNEPNVQTLALNGGKRVDYALTPTGLETANEYFSALAAHTSYFSNPDVSLFILRILKDRVSDW